MTIEIRAVREDELAAFMQTVFETFGADTEIDPDAETRHRALIEPGQSWCAFDRGAVVATAGTFNLEIGVPGGGSLPIAGLTVVTVRPSHRRRGILRELMRLHLDDARARGLPASGLWASEAAIYGRFGYGLSSYCDVFDIPGAHQLRIAPDLELDAVEWIDEARARATLPPIYARATADRPGALRRTPAWWRERRFLESPWARAGASKRRHVLAVRGGEITGYLAYRQRGKFSDGMPDGKLEVNELIATDARAEATLWRFACSVDLFPHVGWWNAPADSALPWLADDMRRVRRRRSDGIWLRLEDVAGTLARRGYQIDAALRLGVAGATYELVAAAGRGACTRTTRPAEIELSPQALATLYLGCEPASVLARAGLVRGDAPAIERADRLFASAVAPWCPEVF